MKIILKGGSWKNTEDEILKAAVMKYGKNQWARISSLLNRKSPKQCKARWYEWLDPSIKKTEWSKDEDEKLLHLAKLMPTQWRTIAPIIGRTASQCLQRYQRLLDEAELRESSSQVEGAPTADEIRKLRPGEIDPDPETKPAKPDPVDMDEDEKEMLSEARARLANTQGKKAKRKARERQLEEARRLAAIEKRKELKSAGIEFRYRRRKGEFDYNAEMAFPVHTPAGFYDTQEEKDSAPVKSFVGMSVADLEPKTRTEQETEDRKRELEKKKEQKERGIFKVPNLNRAQEEHRIAKRRKLELPAPQIRDGELDELVKLSQNSEMLRASVDDSEVAPSRGLLSDYRSELSARISDSQSATPARTPMAHDTVHAEASNVLRLQNMQTPLLGGDNAALISGGTGFAGVTPRSFAVQTPNPVAAGLTPAVAGGDDGVSERLSTVRSSVGARSSATPLRDDLRINNDVESGAGGDWDGGDAESEAPSMPSMQNVRMKLEFGFSALPKPKNDFEIILPEVEDDRMVDEGGDSMDLDMADLEDQMLAQQAEEERRLLAARSTPVRRQLPRPSSLQALQAYKSEIETSEQIQQMINSELILLIERDMAVHPYRSPIHIGKQMKVEQIDQKYIELAKVELQREAIMPDPFPSIDKLERFKSVIVLNKEGNFRIVPDSDAKPLDIASAMLKLGSQLFKETSDKASNFRYELDQKLTESVTSAEQLRKKLMAARNALLKSSRELEEFELMLETETRIIIPERLEKLKAEVKRVQDLETIEQQRYRELSMKN